MPRKSTYITISELANLTRVNIKSLRYYEQMDVLKPAYVDPHTHYRYYTCSQIPLVQLIQFYIETDIPISELQHYSQDGAPILRDSLFFGLANAQRKLQKLQNSIQQATELLEELDRCDGILEQDATTICDMPSKICYTFPIFGEITQNLYYSSLHHMLQEMQHNNLPIGHEMGILNFRSNNTTQTFLYATVNISQQEITDDTHFVRIPSQNFHCKQGDFSMISQKNLSNYFGPENIPEFWTLSEIYSSSFDCNHPLFELRWVEL